MQVCVHIDLLGCAGTDRTDRRAACYSVHTYGLADVRSAAPRTANQ